ncbi:MAG: polyprenyl synthetase family protein [Balneolaceae bacterium]|nr:polyprenyl synthetase family protein [Balneolaceae bacterium]
MKTTELQQQISRYIDRQLEGLDLPGQPASLYDPVRYTLSRGGKRIRPYFTLAGCGLCGGEMEKALPAALAIELLHNFTLLHDDIMDRAETRRGQESVHVKWDDSTAILSGDAMYAWAFRQLQRFADDPGVSRACYARIMDIFMECVVRVCEGQAFDLEFERREQVSMEEYMTMIGGKTAALICASLQMGGVVAGAGRRDVEVLADLGEEIGLAFQIQDDLLDSVADPEKFGKKQGGDIAESKKTYLSILSLQRSTDDQKHRLDRVFTREAVSSGEIDMVIDLYHELDVIDDTRAEVKRRYTRALDILDHFEDSKYREDISLLIRNLNQREF